MAKNELLDRLNRAREDTGVQEKQNARTHRSIFSSFVDDEGVKTSTRLSQIIVILKMGGAFTKDGLNKASCGKCWGNSQYSYICKVHFQYKAYLTGNLSFLPTSDLIDVIEMWIPMQTSHLAA